MEENSGCSWIILIIILIIVWLIFGKDGDSGWNWNKTKYYDQNAMEWYDEAGYWEDSYYELKNCVETYENRAFYYCL
jgi:hypothetical protein